MNALKIVLLTVILFISACKSPVSESVKQSKAQVETALLIKSDFVRFHNVPAVLLAENRAGLSFQLSGKVDQVWVKIGQHVEKGQAMMHLYNPNIDPTLNANLANLEAIQASIEQAEKDVLRLQELRRKNSTSKNAFEHKQTELKNLVAQKKSMQAQIDLAVANQKESTVYAPYAGSVVAVNKQVGEFVLAGQIVTVINQQEALEVEVNLTLSLWGNLQMGDLIYAQFKSERINFKVVELAQSANPKSHLMKVILALDGTVPNGIGQQVILEFPEHYNNVYQLLLEVIVDDGINKPYLFVEMNGKAVKHYITPLYIENGQIIFSSDRDIQGSVVVKGQTKISSGMKLQAMR